MLIADTAGLRVTPDEIEAEGVRRALERAAHADLKLLLFDGGLWPKTETETLRLIDDGHSRVEQGRSRAGEIPRKIPGEISGGDRGPGAAAGVGDFGRGLEALLAKSAAPRGWLLAAGDEPVLTWLRHRRPWIIVWSRSREVCKRL